VNRGFYPTDTSLHNIRDKNFLLYLSDDQTRRLVRTGKKIEILKQMDDYPITRMNMKFINKSSREKTLHKMNIIEVIQP